MVITGQENFEILDLTDKYLTCFEKMLFVLIIKFQSDVARY